MIEEIPGKYLKMVAMLSELSTGHNHSCIGSRYIVADKYFEMDLMFCFAESVI